MYTRFYTILSVNQAQIKRYSQYVLNWSDGTAFLLIFVYYFPCNSIIVRQMLKEAHKL